MIEFRGPAKRLDDTDLPRIGATIGVGEDEIHAVLDVESAGSGFDSNARPKMLFEPHIFYRNLSGANRDRAVQLGLAYANWGALPYPKDSYPRLVAAIGIDESAALRSASFGLGQILGENFKAAGFASVQAMVLAFVQSEAKQLEGMIAFIKANKLDQYLRSHNWAAFANGYNGAGYKKNAYDTKLANAFARWQRIKDTQLDPSKPPTVLPKPVPPDPVGKPIPPVVARPSSGGWLAALLSIFSKKA